MTLNTEVISSDYPTQELYRQPSATRIVFIDPQVQDYQSLIAGVLPETSVVVLEADQDGIEQISQALASHQKVNSLHIVSHGAPGRIQLGNSQLSNGTLNRYAAQLKSWANALSSDTQLLLYGCQVAQTDQGIAFIKHLSELTGAIVTASNHLTGSTSLGGDWELQVSTGAKASTLAFRQEVMTAYASVLASGVLDTTFGTGGKVTTDLGGIFDSGNSIVLQSDGQILVAGTNNGNFALARYNSNGTLDSTFDGDGKVTTSFGSNESGNSIVLQSDGKILVAGTSNGDFALARYNSNGSLDNTFDSDGKVTTSFGSNESGNSIVLQSDGKILVAGTSNGDFALARYNGHGGLDNTFGTGGKVTTDFGIFDSGNSVVLQPDGKILVAGTSNGDFALARYNSNGSLDNTFGTDGKVTTDFGIFDSGNSVVLQPDGKILIAGTSNGDFALARYNSNGSLDTTFGTGGKVTTEFGSLFDNGYSVVLQPDGQILVAGTSNGDFAVARYSSNGSLDTTFGTGGKVTTEFGSLFDNGYSIVLQPDGQILVAGTSNGEFAVARYLVNQIPTDISLSNSTINENSGNNSVVGNFSTTDPDTGDTFTYTLLPGAGDVDNAAFTINGHQLVINNSPDFESKSIYNIRVQTIDSSGISFEKELTINVNDVNETPTDLVLSQTNVNENSGNNSIVGNFSTTDPDTGDTFTYTLLPGAGDVDNAAFTINGHQLVINNSPDFESKSIYNIRVQTIDSSGISFEKELTINVNDVNETPTDLVLSQTNVNENSGNNSIVGNFSTTDPDTGDTFTYTLLSGAGDVDNAAFTINGHQLVINNSPDFESKSSYNIRVQTIDSSGISFEKELTINVNDVNEAPTDLVLSQTNVNENSGNNSIVGNFSTTDPDTGDTFTYTLLSGAGDVDNAAFTINGHQLVINNSPDFESKSSYNIRVQTIDSSGISFEKELTINVNDVNEAPTDLVLSQTNVNENVAALTEIGTFATIDSDIGNTFTYNFVSGIGSTDNDTFILEGNRLKIKNSPDFETKSTYNVRVSSTDNSGLAIEKALTININDLDIPTRLTNSTDDIFNITSDGAKANLQFSLTGHSSNQINELGLFTVDDAMGKINGIAPGTAGYAQAALERSQVIFASIANSPNGFDTNNLTRILELDSGDNLRFYLVKNGTTDNVRSGVTPITDLLFADASTQNITDLGADIFSLGWKDAAGNSNADFQDLVVRVQPTNKALPLGANLQGDPQAELIDLRGVTTQMKADFIVNREAAFNNYISFYQVADQNGGIDTDGNGTVDLRPGDLGYAQAAVSGRVAGIDLMVNNQGTATYSGIFQPGAIFAPFLIVNGTPDAILDGNTSNDPAVYFSFLGANSDQVDHISLLGDNIFGFEDLPGGGDKDFNDMIVQVNLTIA